MIVSSRSKMDAAHHCRRYRWWKYEADGGLSRVREGLPTLTGTDIHRALALVIQGQPIDAAVAEVRKTFEATLRAQYALHPALEVLIAEQAFMLEGLVRAAARVRIPRILDDHITIDVEREMRWHLDVDVQMPLRADWVLRHTRTGRLVLKDWKTLAYANVGWVKGWERNAQILAYLSAAEDLYGEPFEGLSIEGLVRGKRAKDTSKAPMFDGRLDRIQQSPLCYAYKNTLSSTFAPKYQAGKVWEKVALWEEMTAKEWIEDYLSAEDVEGLFCAPVPPIAPNAQRLASWRTQAGALEREIADKARLVRIHVETPTFPSALDVAFPQNFSACLKYGTDYECEFAPICFNGQVAEAPLESGLFEPRQDHHEEEE